MDPNTFINTQFLFLLNVSFMVAGIFLNAVVIISLWRSSKLRKKLCYFLIFDLSCCDLAVVAIYHPVLILSTILWSMQIYYEDLEIKNKQTYLCWILLLLLLLLFIKSLFKYSHNRRVTLHLKHYSYMQDFNKT